MLRKNYFITHTLLNWRETITGFPNTKWPQQSIMYVLNAVNAEDFQKRYLALPPLSAKFEKLHTSIPQNQNLYIKRKVTDFENL